MRYAVKHEMAYTLADLLLRRTHLAFEMRDHGTQIAERVARDVADLLGWNDRDIAAALESYARDIQRVFAIDS
jgi:glycerol-3-phosphate dehydrogenase